MYLQFGPHRSALSAIAIMSCLIGCVAASQNTPSNSKKPNILFIMGDDVGWFNIGAYHRGIMSGKTPNLDKLAAERMIFTDYHAEASCTAGRANFITGELPIRTGLTTVGQAGESPDVRTARADMEVEMLEADLAHRQAFARLKALVGQP